MFTMDEIRTRIKQVPFAPVRIRTSLGDTIDVKNPRLVMFLRERIIVGQPTEEDPDIYEKLDYVWIPYITALEDVPVRRRRNGKKGKRKNREP